MDNRHQGFTLLEVMVALAIFSLVAIALLKTMMTNVNITRLVDEKQLAGWVAENRLSLAMLDRRRFTTSPTQGSEEMNGITFYWRETGQAAGDNLWINRVEVRSHENQQAAISTLDVWVK